MKKVNLDKIVATVIDVLKEEEKEIKKRKKMKVKISNIKWDTKDKRGLPTLVKIIIPSSELEGENEESHEEIIEEYISEYLSDEYGFTHFGFNYHKIKEEEKESKEKQEEITRLEKIE